MTSPLIEHFDHFVVPVDDIVVAEDFYTKVLGAEIATGRNGRPMRYGLNVLHQSHGMRPHTFFVAAGKRIGVYLQTEMRPAVGSNRGAPTYSFETSISGLRQIVTKLEQASVVFEGPLSEDDGISTSAVYFSDPAGNHYSIYVAREPNGTSRHPRKPDSLLTAVGYLNLEAPDLDASVSFYVETFGLPPAQFSIDLDGNRKAILTLPSGQLLILTQVPFSPKGMKLTRTEPGPHLAFYVPASRWDEMCARLSSLGIPHGDRAAEAKGRSKVELDTYIDDPAGHVIQLISSLESV